MHFKPYLSLIAACALTACGPKPAQPPKPAPEIAKTAPTAPDSAAPIDQLTIDQTVQDVTGPWDFSGMKGDPSCRIQFTATAMTGAFVLNKATTCDKDFPILANVAGWIVKGDGNIALTDKDRRIVLSFSQQEDGLYLSTTPAEETYSLVNQDQADFAAPSPSQQIDGHWLVTLLGGQNQCAIDLKSVDENAAAGSVALSTPCPNAGALKEVVSFKFAGENLALLNGAGKPVLTFQRGDSVSWRATGGAQDQLFLTR